MKIEIPSGRPPTAPIPLAEGVHWSNPGPPIDIKPTLLSPEYLANWLAETQIMIDNLTKDQLADALRQAIACGDFQRCVMLLEMPGQNVIYIPFAREQQLRAEIQRLTDLLEKHHIDPNSL